jgi:hypothetical protein
MNNKILLDKNGVKIIKLTDNTFNILFSLENSRDVRPFINLNLIKLLHDLNPDLFEAYSAVDINATERHICLLLKDLFADLGIPQYYYNFAFSLDLCTIKSPTSSCFISDKDNGCQAHEMCEGLEQYDKFIISHINEKYNDQYNDQYNVPTHAICAPLSQCELEFTLINNTICRFNIIAHINNAELFNSSFFEKMAVMILYKVINRLKHFINTIN